MCLFLFQLLHRHFGTVGIAFFRPRNLHCHAFDSISVFSKMGSSFFLKFCSHVYHINTRHYSLPSSKAYQVLFVILPLWHPRGQPQGVTPVSPRISYETTLSGHTRSGVNSLFFIRSCSNFHRGQVFECCKSVFGQIFKITYIGRPSGDLLG